MLRELDDLCQLAAAHEMDVTLAVRASGAELGLAVSRDARRRGVPSQRRCMPMREISGSHVARAAERLRVDLLAFPPPRHGSSGSGRTS